MGSDYHLDEIDKRILYHLAADARDTAAPEIAEAVDVTPATIRNRIDRLEDHGIIRGYDAAVDYERADDLTTTQFTCTAAVEDRQRLAQEVGLISGVVAVRELLAGRENLQVTAVARDSDDVARIGRELSALGLSVEQEDTVRREYRQPYAPFGPGENGRDVSLTDFRSLSGSAEVVEVTVSESAAIAGRTIEAASDSGLLEDVLVVNVERGDEMLTPDGTTELRPGDVITMLSRDAMAAETIRAFEAPGSDAASE